ncbi:MAG: hypothetical protein JO167_07890 [Alphaproteobacteria bacterium]|nr:hypothetical protein [Alphaproteobacteria bacterium]
MKIPFERTISGAYRFAFANILSLLGIAWLPYFLMAALIGGGIYLYGPQVVAAFNAMAAQPKPAPQDALRFFGLIVGAELLILPVFLILTAMVNVGVMRKALGQHPGPVFVFFSLGSQVWRLVGSYLIFTLIFAGLLMLLVALGMGLYFALAQASQGGAIAASILFGIFGYFFVIYAAVRTYFFIPAIVVAENHIGIRRSWHLGAGNFWRIIGIVLIMTIPLSMAAQTIMQPVLQFYMGGAAQTLPPHASPEEMKQFFSMIWTAIKRAGPWLLLIQLVQMGLSSGLMGGAIAQAYNLVTGGPEIVPPKASA